MRFRVGTRQNRADAEQPMAACGLFRRDRRLSYRQNDNVTPKTANFTIKRPRLDFFVKAFIILHRFSPPKIVFREALPPPAVTTDFL